MKSILVLLLSTFSFSLLATHYIYTSKDGNVKLYVTQNILGKSYVTALKVKNNKCAIKKPGGPIKGHINASISFNFATFGWHLPQNGAINGTLTNASVHSYAKNYVEWSNLTKFGCQIQAGKATLPHVTQH